MSAPIQMQVKAFGTTQGGRAAKKFTITNKNGMSLSLTNYGGIITNLLVPDKEGKLADVVLGYDTLQDYEQDTYYLSATVGRVANRIAQASFRIDGEDFKVPANNGPNGLHGGARGFNQRVFKASQIIGEEAAGVTFTYVSQDGEEGYPGALKVNASYVLTQENELVIDLRAECVEDPSSGCAARATPVNLVNHAYYNLAGHDQADILQHEVMVNAQLYTPVDSTLIPTGAMSPVVGSPLDLQSAKQLGAQIKAADAAFTANEGTNGGYDHNYILNKTSLQTYIQQCKKGENKRQSGDKNNMEGSLSMHADIPSFECLTDTLVGCSAAVLGKMTHAASIKDPKSGRAMDVYTTQPGMQLYTGNFIDNAKGRNNTTYSKFQGFCLETQNFPDAVNQPHFPNCVLRPGKEYRHVTVHKFSN